MITRRIRMLVAGTLIAICCKTVSGQGSSSVILNVNTENSVVYLDDVSDVSRFATNLNVTAAVVARNFQQSIVMADIVSVNGQPAKGVVLFSIRTINLRTAPTPGQAIADVMRTNTQSGTFEILSANGTPVGTIMTSGLGGAGPAPAGAPLAVNQGNNTIVGGTGAFLGARGQQGQAVTSQTIGNRQASMTEDPANRRQNGGGKLQFVLDVIPMFRPEVILTQGFPSVTHSNGVLVEAQPARSGEILSLFATGLGPTLPGIDPGKTFTANPVQIVNSPVQVTVNGRPAEVLSAVGVPDTVDTYKVDFLLPSALGSGPATIQVTSGFIPGPEFQIPVR